MRLTILGAIITIRNYIKIWKALRIIQIIKIFNFYAGFLVFISTFITIINFALKFKFKIK